MNTFECLMFDIVCLYLYSLLPWRKLRPHTVVGWILAFFLFLFGTPFGGLPLCIFLCWMWHTDIIYPGR